MCATSCRRTASTRQHELGRTGQECTCPEMPKSFTHIPPHSRFGDQNTWNWSRKNFGLVKMKWVPLNCSMREFLYLAVPRQRHKNVRYWTLARLSEVGSGWWSVSTPSLNICTVWLLTLNASVATFFHATKGVRHHARGGATRGFRKASHAR